MATEKVAPTSAPTGSETVTVELTLVERLYVKRSLELLAASLRRSRKNEVDGSEIWHLRGREIDAVSRVQGKVA